MRPMLIISQLIPVVSYILYGLIYYLIELEDSLVYYFSKQLNTALLKVILESSLRNLYVKLVMKQYRIKNCWIQNYLNREINI
jgi:hypothetical protein